MRYVQTTYLLEEMRSQKMGWNERENEQDLCAYPRRINEEN